MSDAMPFSLPPGPRWQSADGQAAQVCRTGSHGATVTFGLRRIRLALNDSGSVMTSSRPSSITNHTGVASAVPSRLYLVRLRYLPGRRGASPQDGIGGVGSHTGVALNCRCREALTV